MTTEKLLNILITGANRGIGLEMVRQYAASGVPRVHACCRAPQRASELRRVEGDAGGRVVIHQLDVVDTRQIEALAQELSSEAIDLLVNNAGVYGGPDDGLAHVSEAAWLDVLRVNTVAPLKVSSAFLPQVAASRRRIIASVSSKMGSLDDNTSGGYYAYRSSKAALNMVMKNLSIELRDRGITCVSLNPGWVRTDMGGSAAPLSPEQSVRGLRKVLDAVTLDDSGKFFSHDGAEVAW